MEKTEVLVKRVTSLQELEACAALERQVWGSEPIPLHQTLTAVKNGGLMIGAYAGEQLVGFSYGFAGFARGEVYLCSHMLGIDAAYRNAGIGYRLKIAQAEAARELGYGKIRWTYDPLESRNAFLNISKLGAICSDYIENCYGDMDDELNRGLPSDRFHVEWLIDSPHLQNRQERLANVEVQEGQLLLGWSVREDGLPVATEREYAWEAEFLFVPIPLQFQEMKKADRELAIDWRMKTRQVLREAFARGFAVAEITRTPGEPVQHYALVQRSSLALDERGVE